jgi:hypothetical protein
MFVLNLYAYFIVGLLVVMFWKTVRGVCPKCRNERVTKCGCDPTGRRRPWKNQR